jgi:hypothetical protein
MLVSLAALLTLQITATAFLAIFHQVLAFAGPSDARFLESSLIFVDHFFVILVIVNCALATVRFTTRGGSDSMAR